MTPDQRIDANIDAFLKACGMPLFDEWVREHPDKTHRMREAMKAIMLDSYTRGTKDNFDAMVAAGRWKK